MLFCSVEEISDRRLAVVKELYRTEDAFLEHLRNIFDVYMEPLRFVAVRVLLLMGVCDWLFVWRSLLLPVFSACCHLCWFVFNNRAVLIRFNILVDNSTKSSLN